MEVKRVDLANWALRTSSKFTTGVKYQFNQGFWPDKWSGNPNHPSSYLTYHHHHQSVLPKGRSFPANAGTKAEVLLKGRSSTANSETKAAVLPGMNRYGRFLLLSAPHLSLASEQTLTIWKDLRGTDVEVRRWIWLTGPSGLHRNSPLGLNISSTRVFDQIRVPEIPISLLPLHILRFICGIVYFCFLGLNYLSIKFSWWPIFIVIQIYVHKNHNYLFKP